MARSPLGLDYSRMETIRDVNTFHERERDWRRWEMRRALLTVSLLMAGCRGAARPPPSGVVEVKITENGFEPDRLEDRNLDAEQTPLAGFAVE